MGLSVHVKSLGLAALLVSALGAGMVRTAGAQDATPTAATVSPATISVSGDGSVLVAPDIASVSIGVNIVDPDLTVAQEKAGDQITAVLGALKEAGIDDKDIQTSSYNVSLLQNYDNNGMPGEITGYQVNQQLNVTVRKIDKLGGILSAAVAKGANSIYGITFMVSDSTKAASQARTMAVADATKKAQELATAAGGSLGRILSITESYAPSNMPYAGGSGMAMADSAKAVPISGGTNAISVSVQITFELVQ